MRTAMASKNLRAEDVSHRCAPVLQPVGEVAFAQPLQGEVQGRGGDEGAVLDLLPVLQGHDLLLLVDLGHLVVLSVFLHGRQYML